MIVSDSSIIRVNRFSLSTFRPDQRSRKDCSRSARPYNRKAFVKKSAFIGTENFPREFYEELKSFSRRELLIFTIRQKQNQDP